MKYYIINSLKYRKEQIIMMSNLLVEKIRLMDEVSGIFPEKILFFLRDHFPDDDLLENIENELILLSSANSLLVKGFGVDGWYYFLRYSGSLKGGDLSQEQVQQVVQSLMHCFSREELEVQSDHFSIPTMRGKLDSWTNVYQKVIHCLLMLSEEFSLTVLNTVQESFENLHQNSKSARNFLAALLVVRGDDNLKAALRLVACAYADVDEKVYQVSYQKLLENRGVHTAKLLTSPYSRVREFVLYLHQDEYPIDTFADEVKELLAL